MTLPTRTQLNEAIHSMHAARRSWPPPDFLTEAGIAPERMIVEYTAGIRCDGDGLS